MAPFKDKKIQAVLLIYGVFVIAFHLFWLQLGEGDDSYYRTLLEDATIWEILLDRWNNWSSRCVIEGFLLLVAGMPSGVWMVLDILVSMLIGALVVWFLFYKENKVVVTIPFAGILLLLFLSYDFRELSSAGWITTTINYWWSLAALLLAFLPLTLSEFGSGRKWVYFISVPVAIFSINHEQICILVLITSLYLILRDLCQKRSVSWYVCLLVGLSIISLYAILTCPGNQIRSDFSGDLWFPEYKRFHLLQKGLLGWYSVLLTLYKEMNWTYVLLTGILFFTVAAKKRRPFELMIAGLPFASNIGLLVLKGIAPICNIDLVHYIINIFEFDRPVVWYQGSLPNKARLLLFIYTICCLCVAYSLSFVWGTLEEYLDMLMLLVSAVISKVSMGMSPTVWISVERTSVFMNYGFLILAAFCALEWMRTDHSYFRPGFHKIKQTPY